MKIIEEYEQQHLKVKSSDKPDRPDEINELWNNLISYQEDPAMVE